MTMFGRTRKRNSGFSLLELLLCIFALSMLMTVIASSGRRVKQSAMSTICMNNLRQISIAMATYYNDYKDYPRGLPYSTLPDQLHSYLPDSAVFVCPVDRTEESDSYSEFYVYRSEQLAKMKYTIGCPRHKDDKESVNIFSLGRTARGRVRKVMVDNVPVYPGSACTGTITLEDGTTITSSAVSMFVIQSFRMDDGRLYTIIRALDGESGTIDVQATPGTNLEIVTPSLIAAVRGTAYTVSVGYYGLKPVTEVSVSSGEVSISPLNGFFPLNNAWTGAGKQPISLFPCMQLTVYGQDLKVDAKSIGGRLNTLRRKIDKGISSNQDVSSDVDIFDWLGRFVNVDCSNISWIENPPDHFVPEETIPDFIDPESLPPGPIGGNEEETIPAEGGEETQEEPEGFIPPGLVGNENSEQGTEGPPPGSDEWLIWVWWLFFGGGRGR
ncbi:MAG: FecR domain-containing protein [Candidatus Auribacterota bacterium]|jgi:type II secretory pathway pseudopilin PulG|nr:FecR domain-containing protein [Candidatus Auribacterota bacterium]